MEQRTRRTRSRRTCGGSRSNARSSTAPAASTGRLPDGRRRSMQPMAERLGTDHQQLQQFMTSSTWPVQEVRARLATARA
ncbi:transposase [Streptomyces sp. G-G2]|uniref:transposase n=1 Tax=Streptomyces sp. G-G2 TaxID=3046201 RepID=UPI0032D92F08